MMDVINIIPNKVFCAFIAKDYKFSTHIYDKNFASDTEITQNIDNIKNSLEIDELILLKQIHGDNVCLIDNDAPNLTADGIVTKRINVGIGIKTADCVPVLIAANDGSTIAAIHCGWRGALSNLIANTVQNLKSYNQNMTYVAVIGPSIMYTSYEVGDEIYNIFIDVDNDNKNFFFNIDKSKYLFDIRKYVIAKLKFHNIDTFKTIDHNTYTDNRYFSYRKNCHDNIIDNKRMVSVVWKK